MKLPLTRQRNRGLTRTDVLILIALSALVAFFLGPFLIVHRSDRELALRLNCNSNLRQIGLAARVWEGDHDNKYPMAVSVTNGGAKELIATGNVAAVFLVISNELSTTKILWCPADTNRTYAANFDELNRSNISYFLSPDVTNDTDDKLILDGDDNLESNGSPVKSGLINVSTNFSITWAAGRHSQTYRRHFWSPLEKDYLGNMGLADGSVEEYHDWMIRNWFQYLETGTNRLAIP